MSVHSALLAFQKEFQGAKKTAVNPHFKNEYFSLDDIVHATTPLLTKHGLYVSHGIETIDGITALTTLLHTEGTGTLKSGDADEYVSSSIPLPVSQNPQAMGSAITYYKRYNLCCLLNIAEADDDGNAASALISDHQASTIRDYIETLEINEAKFLHVLGAATIETIPAIMWDKAMAGIHAKERQVAKDAA